MKKSSIYVKNYYLCLIKQIVLLSIFIIITGISLAQDKVLDICTTELKKQMEDLGKQELPPYYISYRIDDITETNISSSFGNIKISKETKERLLTVSVRVGSHQLDNWHELRDDYSGWLNYNLPVTMVLDTNEKALSQVLWKETDKRYKTAVERFGKVNANIAVKVEEEDKSADFSKESAVIYFEPSLPDKDIQLNIKLWENIMKEISKEFLNEPDIYDCTANISYKAERKYFIASDGTKIAQNLRYARIYLNAKVKAKDGMVLPLTEVYFAFSPEDLPDIEQLKDDTKALVSKLTELKNAPVADSYSGPAIMSGSAAGVFFHEIFGHRVEGQRLRSETDAQTFKKKVGKKVVSENLSVVFSPTIKEYKGKALNGYFLYDDQGVKGSKVTIVKNGILKGFLMSRVPIENFSNSNGHGRAQPGLQPVTRQSNMFIETNKAYSMEKLRKMLISEIKKQGTEYGYFFKRVSGGFTSTGRYRPNAFNVTPTEVYRVYADGRPDELIRGVNMIGTPLAMFSEIEAAGGEYEIFIGICGAESGSVPVSCVCPVVYVKKIETQKKRKSQERPLILSRPDSNK